MIMKMLSRVIAQLPPKNNFKLSKYKTNFKNTPFLIKRDASLKMLIYDGMDINAGALFDEFIK